MYGCYTADALSACNQWSSCPLYLNVGDRLRLVSARLCTRSHVKSAMIYRTCNVPVDRSTTGLSLSLSLSVSTTESLSIWTSVSSSRYLFRQSVFSASFVSRNTNEVHVRRQASKLAAAANVWRVKRTQRGEMTR